MTPDELREKVARAMYELPVRGCAPHGTWEQTMPEIKEAYLDEATAAIALVLEEAAKVVTENYQTLCTEHRLLLVNRAAAIRAMKGERDE